MINTPCEVIRDLLPLYIDEACSQSSKTVIAEHIDRCADCRKQLEAMNSELSLSIPVQAEDQDARAIQTLAKTWRKTKILSWIKGVAVATCTCSAIIALYFLLTEWKIIPVPADKFEVSHVYQLSDGSISYWLKVKDGYELHMLEQTYDGQGNTYIQGYRPIIKKKSELKYGLHNYMYRIELNTIQQINVNQFDLNSIDVKEGITIDITDEQTVSEMGSQLKGVYYGTKENSLLIWKEGMNLPKASKELEGYWLNYKDGREFPTEVLN